MTRMHGKKSTRYTVGYKKPPKKSQFRPGQSGNPNGRPKGIRPIGALLTEILQQKIPIAENGRTRRLPALLVMLRRLANDGLRGDKKAIQFLLTLVDRYGQTAEAVPQLNELLDEDVAIIARYLPETSKQ